MTDKSVTKARAKNGILTSDCEIMSKEDEIVQEFQKFLNEIGPKVESIRKKIRALQDQKENANEEPTDFALGLKYGDTTKASGVFWCIVKAETMAVKVENDPTE